MSDDRFHPDNNPPTVPCRRYVDQPRDEVTAEEIDAWLDGFEREHKIGKYRVKRPASATITGETHARGEGRDK